MTARSDGIGVHACDIDTSDENIHEDRRELDTSLVWPASRCIVSALSRTPAMSTCRREFRAPAPALVPARSAFGRGLADSCIHDRATRRHRRPRCAAGAHVGPPVAACPPPGPDRSAAAVRTIALAFRAARGSRSLRRDVEIVRTAEARRQGVEGRGDRAARAHCGNAQPERNTTVNQWQDTRGLIGPINPSPQCKNGIEIRRLRVPARAARSVGAIR